MKNKLIVVPENSGKFVDTVIANCHLLIGSGIWKEIKLNKFNLWWKNFKSEEEQYFAACLLDKVIYRNEEQVLELVRFLFQRSIPDLFRLSPPPSIITEYLPTYMKSKSSNDFKVRLVASTKDPNSVTGSAQQLLRIFKIKFKIKDGFIIKPNRVPNAYKNGVRVFIFIDDIVGSGQQFCDVIKNNNLNSYLGKAYFAYTPLVANVIGIKKIKDDYPDIKISCVEMLDKRHNVFTEESEIFSENGNDPKKVKEFYLDMLSKRNIKVRDDVKLGWGELGLTYLFHYRAPNNSLPIFWYNKFGWNNLVER